MTPTYKYASHLYKATRLNHHMTQQQLADEAGVAQLSIFRLEHNQNVSLDFLTKVADAMNCQLELRLIEKDENNNDK